MDINDLVAQIKEHENKKKETHTFLKMIKSHSSDDFIKNMLPKEIYSTYEKNINTFIPLKPIESIQFNSTLTAGYATVLGNSAKYVYVDEFAAFSDASVTQALKIVPKSNSSFKNQTELEKYYEQNGRQSGKTYRMIMSLKAGRKNSILVHDARFRNDIERMISELRPDIDIDKHIFITSDKKKFSELKEDYICHSKWIDNAVYDMDCLGFNSKELYA